VANAEAYCYFTGLVDTLFFQRTAIFTFGRSKIMLPEVPAKKIIKFFPVDRNNNIIYYDVT